MKHSHALWLPCGVFVIVVLLSLPHAWSAQLVRSEAGYDDENGLGVAKLVIQLNPVSDLQAWRAQVPWVMGGGVMYQITEPPRLIQELGAKLIGQPVGTPRRTDVYFLFKRDQPFQITVVGESEPILIEPDTRKPLVRRLFNEWWRTQQAWLKQDSSNHESYPPYLQSYLSGVHSRRLGLRLPPAQVGRMTDVGKLQTADLLTGSESLRQKMFWQAVHGLEPAESPDLELPEPIQFSEPVYQIDEEVDIEPIARQVPSDCFYIRFGRYSNLLWFQHLMDEHAADLGRLVTLRGVNADYGNKLQSQLVIDKLPFADLIGDKVIADVALIGRDMFFREGAAVGLILQENAPIVGQGIRKRRRETAEKDEQATLQDVKVANVEVSLLSTPDHRIRSFYVARDGFHFVTNCRWMMDRFLRLGSDIERLSDTSAFQHARNEMPLDREDTLFAYCSPRFFAGLFSPHYRIEMQRRLRASCELDIVRLANLAWANEVSHDFLGDTELAAFAEEEDWLAQLAALRLLPKHFADREDRSRPVPLGSDWVDSRRGGRGSFLPIPDTAVTSASPSEVSDYAALAEYHSEDWRQFDPLIVAVGRAKQREPVADTDSDKAPAEIEQLTVDASLMTMGQSKYGRFAHMLGEPTSKQLSCGTPLIASFQASLTNRLNPSGKSNFASWGALDRGATATTNRGGLLGAWALLRTAPAFLTVTDGSLLSGKLLDRFRQFDEEGYFQGIGELWRRKHGEFTSLSYDRSVLEEVTPNTKWIETDLAPAQVRLHVGHLAESQLADWLAAAARERCQRASLRNVRLMNAFISQLAVAGPEARRHAEKLVGAQLICALGGDYQWQAASDNVNAETGRWISSAWSADPGELVEAPHDTQPAVLGWCNGLDADLTQNKQGFVVHATLLMRRQPDEPKFEFSPLKFFSGKTSAKKTN
jgi:hypothetical protein